MPSNDPIGDMIARIKNAGERRRSKVLTPASRMRQRVLDVLQAEGYIRGYSRSETAEGFAQFEIELKYYDNEPVIAEISRVSKPGRRVYTCDRRFDAVDPMGGPISVAPQRRDIRWLHVGQNELSEHRSVVGFQSFIANHGDAPGEARVAQGHRGRRTARA